MGSQIRNVILGRCQDGDQPGRLCPHHSQLSLNAFDRFLTCLKKKKKKKEKLQLQEPLQ